MTAISAAESYGRWMRIALLALAPALLSACGGGGGTVADGGIIGTGISIASVGSVSAVGRSSVTVNGVDFRTLSATVTVDGQPSTPAALQVGQVVTVQGQTQPDGTATATSIATSAEVKGTVSGVDSVERSFTVLGQRVRTDQLTVFSGGTFDTLLNQYVEVNGFRAAPGDVLATRVDITATVAPAAQLSVAGTVSAFDGVGKTFMIGAQAVDFSQIGAAFLPAGLGNGVLVAVTGTTVSAGGRLVASQIALVPTTVQAPDSSTVELEGIVTEFTGLASFRVSGQLVDGRGATVTGGSPSMVVNGAKVEVEGKIAQGVVTAATIAIEQEADVQLDAQVSAVDATGLTLGGQRFGVTATTQFEDASAAAVRGFGLASVQVGDRLQVTGVRTSAGLVATRVVRLDPSTPPGGSGVPAEVEGTITEFVSVANFKVADQKVNASSARFEGGTASDLANGRRVHAEGVLSGDVLLATTMALESVDAPPTQSVSVQGTITSFVSQANFKVSGQPVDASKASFADGVATDLATGRSVVVQGILANGVLAATKVSFQSAPPATTLQVEGAITNFSSIASFSVAGQAVDASSAAISNGKASDLANGRQVNVVGPVVGGALKATKVDIQDSSGQIEAQVRGAIANFVSVSNFTVASRTVDASSAKFEGGTASKLGNGVQVEVAGALVGGVLKATTVTFDD